MEIMFGSRRRSKKEIPVLRNPIDPSSQDNVAIPSGLFQKFFHIGCAFNLHSNINSGLIHGSQNSSKRQTVFFLPVDPRDISHKDPEKIDLSVPRRAQYLHNAWKKHQDAVFWVDINVAFEKGLKFYQTRSNAIILQETLPAYCIPTVVRMKTGEVLYEKVYMSPRPPPKISLKHEWKSKLGSEHAQRSEVGQLSRRFQSNQPILNPNRERTVRPVIRDDARTVQDGRKTSRSQEIDVNSFHEETVSSERSGQPVVETSAIQPRSSEDSKDANVGKAHERTRRLVIEDTRIGFESCSTSRRGSCSTTRRRSCSTSKIFSTNPTQPTPNPIRDRWGRPDDMQDGRNTSRSQEINVNSFNEEPTQFFRQNGATC